MYIFEKFANEIDATKCKEILDESISFSKLKQKSFRQDYSEKAQIGCINMSDIFSLLIKEAGRICEYYASDVIYDINSVEHWINNVEHWAREKQEDDRYGKSWCFGFRKYGVDHWDFVKNSFCVGRDYYKVYRLDMYSEEGYMYASLYEAEENLLS